MKKGLCSAMAVSVFAVVAAEEPIERMEDIVVSATGFESGVKDVPVKVELISREEIERSQLQTIDEMIKLLPGVGMKRSFTAECGPGRELTLGGVPEQKRTLVLVDGVPVNDGFSGAVNWSLIPKDSVERVELVHGPMSALYGSGAMGGVINIITKTPTPEGLTAVELSAGSDDTYSTFMEHSKRNGAHGYYLSGRFYDTDGYMKVKHPKPYHEKNERQDWNVMGKYFYFPDRLSKLTLSSYAVEENYSRGRIYTDQRNRQLGVQGSYETELGNGDALSLSLFYNYNNRLVEVSGPRPAYNALEHTEENDVHRIGEMFKMTMLLDEVNTFTWGVDASYTFFDKDNDYKLTLRDAYAEGEQVLVSAFAQNESVLDYGEHVFMPTVGLRADYGKSFDGVMFDSGLSVDRRYDEESWSALSPKLGLVYRYKNSTTVRTGIGTSFSAPTLSELYNVFDRGPFVINGNPELDPERSISYTLGLEQRVSEDLNFQIDGFYTRGKDFISTRIVSAPFISYYDNISEVEIKGVNTSLTYAFNSELSSYLGYSYTDSQIVKDEFNSSNEGNDVPFQPNHKFRIGMVYALSDNFSLDLSANYFDERYTAVSGGKENLLDSYVSVDLFMTKKLTKAVDLSIGVENLLDEKNTVYSLPSEEASYSPGLTASISLRITL